MLGRRWLALARNESVTNLTSTLLPAKVPAMNKREYGISTFDSESFELELNGSAWDTSGLSFGQIPSDDEDALASLHLA